MYTIYPTMTFDQAVRCYKQYVKETRERGQKPVSFMHFLIGKIR